MPAPRLTRRQLDALRGGGWAPTAPKRVRRPAPLDDVRLSMAVEVTVPIPTVSEMNDRGHWSARRKRTKLAHEWWRTAVAWFRLGLPPKASGQPWSVTLTRLGGRRLDDDNLASALKATQDAVAEWLRVDDGDPSAVVWARGQEPGGLCGVRVRLECGR